MPKLLMIGVFILLACSTGCAMEWLCREARALSGAALLIPPSRAQWESSMEQRRRQWLEMLGLWPLPERTPLEATVTGILDRGDYVVEKIHFQSVPGAHVAGNLYRPKEITGRLPAVLYLCGHTKGKVNLTYQQNPRWFGQHGYVALVLDPIQLGECQGMHHGTYREGRWDWISRGYTPAGVEVWNAMRALDYLSTRDDVDAERFGVTGLSGGGAMSWDLAAADERIKCVAPVCQTGSVEQIVCDRAVDGHCDCAFWINYYRWDTADLGALIAPRPLLIAAGVDDALWRPYAFRETAHRIKRVYESLGVPDDCDLVEDLSFHGYTPKLRQAIFEWFNHHLKGEDAPVTDDVTDFEEPEQNLLVFGGKLPENDRMQQIDRILIPPAEVVEAESVAQWQVHQADALRRLRELSFRQVEAGRRPHLIQASDDGGGGGRIAYSYEYDRGNGVICRVRLTMEKSAVQPIPTLVTTMREARSPYFGGGADRPGVGEGLATAVVEVRGTGGTQIGEGLTWTIRRACVMCGFTWPERQTNDMLAALALLRGLPAVGSLTVYGKGRWATHAIYAALLDEQVSEIVLESPPTRHTDPDTPEFMGVLRIGDLPQNLALAFPRPITFIGEMPDAYEWTKRAYEKLGQGDKVRAIDSVGDWRPAE